MAAHFEAENLKMAGEAGNVLLILNHSLAQREE